MLEHVTAEALAILVQVVLIDIALSGDNAIVIGIAVAGLPPEQRRRALWLGVAAATVLRAIFAVGATTLLRILGLLLAGGLLLLWVAWKLWRETRHRRPEHAAADGAPRKTLGAALWQIVIADVSMSLDNALAVAGAALTHPWVLVSGLAISVLLMGAAAATVARLLERHPWIAYLGLAAIVYVALKMIWAGALAVVGAVR
jgi:YjbE family integral membrane protein